VIKNNTSNSVVEDGSDLQNSVVIFIYNFVKDIMIINNLI